MLTASNPTPSPMSRTRRLASALAALPLMMGGLSSVAHAAVPAPSGYTLVWSDDFTGAANTGLSSANWIYDTGTSYPGGAGAWGTGEQETMTTSTANVYQDGAGYLNIKPIRASNGTWTAGRVETVRTNFAPPTGGGIVRVEASIQLPNVTGAAAQGYWPAFWMLGAPFRGNYNNWPSIGELDIMENVNGANQTWGTLHCGVAPGGPCNEYTGNGGNRVMGSPSLQSAFHTYAFEWDNGSSPNQFRWYVDGILYHTVLQSDVDATTWTNATNHGYFIILNVAMGGGWPGATTSSTASGAPMKVDYVAVWTKGGTSTGGGGGGSTGTGAEWTYGASNVSTTQALTWFKPTGFSPSYVILHYTSPGVSQQNLNMSYTSGTARYESNVSGISSGQTLSYSFTYNKNGTQYDTPAYTWVKP